MDLLTFKNGNKTVKTTTSLALIYCVIITVAFIFAYFFTVKAVNEVTDNIIVIDTKGQLYPTTSLNSADGRLIEYENHVKIFYTLWYSFNENTYKQNIEAGLHLIGERGKELYNDYKDEKMERMLAEKNLEFAVDIENVVINPETNPVSGYIEGVQTIRRAMGIVSRKLNIKFTVYDISSRTRENIHACKINEWTIYEADILETPKQK